MGSQVESGARIHAIAVGHDPKRSPKLIDINAMIVRSKDVRRAKLVSEPRSARLSPASAGVNQDRHSQKAGERYVRKGCRSLPAALSQLQGHGSSEPRGALCYNEGPPLCKYGGTLS
jgi:hypothetical protein